MYFGGGRVCRRGRLGAGSGISITVVGVEWTVAEGSLSLFGADQDQLMHAVEGLYNATNINKYLLLI